MQTPDDKPPISSHADNPFAYQPDQPDKPVMGGPSSESCTLGMLAHLLGALTGFLGPLIIWLVKKDTDSFVDDQGKEALNFQITILIAMLVCGALTAASCGFLVFLVIVPMIGDWVFSIIGAIEASKGNAYRYPVTLRLIS